jgi:ribosomal protein L7/L12
MEIIPALKFLHKQGKISIAELKDLNKWIAKTVSDEMLETEAKTILIKSERTDDSITVIKEIKTVTGWGLKEAKDFYDNNVHLRTK